MIREIEMMSQFDAKGYHALSDEMERMIRSASPESLANYLKQGKVPDQVISFVFDDALDIPSKLVKWMAFKLRDMVMSSGIETPEEMDSLLKDNRHEVIRIKDWFLDMVKYPGFDINRYPTFISAKEDSDRWHEELTLNMDKGDPKLYKFPDFHSVDMGDGYQMVLVSPDDLENEGNLMGHCVGGDDYKQKVINGDSEIWSLRDHRGYPHVTIELSLIDNHEDDYRIEDFLQDVDEDLSEEEAWEAAEELYYDNLEHIKNFGKKKYLLNQIQGKEDRPPIEKYRKYLFPWAKEQENSGKVEFRDDELLSITPSHIILDMAEKDPSGMDDYMRNIDVSMMPEMLSRMMKVALKTPLGLQDVTKLLTHPEVPGAKQLASLTIDRIMNGEGTYGSSLPMILMKYLSPEESYDFMLALMNHPNSNFREVAILNKFEEVVGDDNIRYMDTPEGAEELKNIILNENDLEVISGILTQYALSTSAPTPPQILSIFPTIMARSERERRDTQNKFNSNYFSSFIQSQIINLATANAPQILPNLVSMIEYVEPGETAKSLNKMMSLLRINDPELYKQTISSMNPKLYSQFTGENDHQKMPEMGPMWVSDDITRIKNDEELLPHSDLIGMTPEWIKDNTWKNREYQNIDLMEENIDDLRATAAIALKMTRLSSKLDARGEHRMADEIDMLRLAMPYRWERSRENAESIIKKGYDPTDSIFTYIDEYSDQFANDLSDDAKQALETYSEEIGLDEELQRYGVGGKRWDKYIEKLSELWFEEHPDEVLLWLADNPNHSSEFGSGDDYDDDLLRYSPPETHAPEPFLNDYSYGYATKVKLPPGQQAIPKEWFSQVSRDEWEQHKDDYNHWDN